jgi:TorA maturation chaperone TorD
MDTEDRNNSILKGYNMLLYFAGTMLMYEPSEECVADFWANDILKKLPVASLNPNFVKAAGLLKNSCPDKNKCRKELRKDYIRLFGNKDQALAPAYESYYRNNSSIDLGYIPSAPGDFYTSYGWKSKFKIQVKDDHLSIELLFLTKLIEKYIALEDIPCRSEMEKEIRRFIDNHILSWVPEWNKKIQLHSNTLSFKGIGTLILACSEDIYSMFDRKPANGIPKCIPKNLD